MKKVSKMVFSESALAPLGVHEQMKLAHLEAVLTEFSPPFFRHMYAPSCTLHMYLTAVWWSHLEFGRGV